MEATGAQKGFKLTPNIQSNVYAL